jgi:hypothetical protein
MDLLPFRSGAQESPFQRASNRTTLEPATGTDLVRRFPRDKNTRSGDRYDFG